jgi:uncharacterized SAM-binding protein YcdF (DUF218 family)
MTPPRRRGAARPTRGIAALVAVAALLLACAAAAASLLARLTRRAEQAAAAPVRRAADLRPAGDGMGTSAEAIVVLGATMYEHGPCDELRARLDHAAALWHLGVAPLILATGGVDGDIDEADGMTAYLVARGIPVSALGTARPGATTRESLQTLRRRGGGPYIMVSSPYHALRILTEARRQGLRVTVSAPPSTPETRRRATHRVRFVSELVATTWYALPQAWTARVSTRPGTVRHVVPGVFTGQAGARALVSALIGRPS